MTSNASGNVDVYASVLTNNVVNLQLTNIAGGQLGGGAAGFRWWGGLLDECASTVACEQLINSKDVYFFGVGAFSGTGASTATAFSNDGQSELHLTDVVCGQFSAGGCFTNANGGIMTLSDVRMFAGEPGGTKCATNNGIVKDLGGNTCVQKIRIAASPTGATSSGNTVTITTLSA